MRVKYWAALQHTLARGCPGPWPLIVLRHFAARMAKGMPRPLAHVCPRGIFHQWHIDGGSPWGSHAHEDISKLV
jgi:hypothetical protein